MDDGVGEEVIPHDGPDGGHLQGKDNEYYIRPESCNVVESQELQIPSEGDYSKSTHQEFEEMCDGKNIMSMNQVNTLEHLYGSSPISMSDTGVSVEELTVKNFSGSNLAIVGASSNSGRVQTVQTRQNQWQHLYQLGSRSGSGSSLGNTAHRDNGQRMTNGLEDASYSSFSDFLAQKACNQNQYEVVEELINSEDRGISSNSPGSVRSKIISKSGFSEFFVKNTLKGKGIIVREPSEYGSHLEPRDRGKTKLAGGTIATSNTSRGMDVRTVNPSSDKLKGKSNNGGNDCDGVSLREWLKVGRSKGNKMMRLHIFRQIVELVDYSHSEGVALHRLRPSYFKMLPLNKVRYLGSPDKREILQSMMNQELSQSEANLARKRLVERNMFSSVDSSAKKQRFNQNIRGPRPWLQLPTNSSFRQEVENVAHVAIPGQQNTTNEFDEGNSVTKHRKEIKFGNPLVSNTREQIVCASEMLEQKWYTSPEEIHEGSCKLLSNIYCLGVFLFELLAHFDSDHQVAAAMSDLRHRILPPSFLSENPKEAGFCLWLLHPEPSSRPRTREILQSEVLNGLPEACTENISASIEQDDSESDLLMHFLTLLEEQKQKDASKLEEDIRRLEADIEEIEKRNCSRLSHSDFKEHLAYSSILGRQNVHVYAEPSRSDALWPSHPVSNMYEQRLMKNIGQLESAYFSMRAKIQHPETNVTVRQDKELLRNRENWCLTPDGEERKIPMDSLGAFFDGFCKYARYSRFEARGVLRNGEFNNSSNVICSMSFDRDEDYFAAAGVSKKIKIFEFNSLFNDSVDIHYPAIEMPNKSMLSCVCWNSYIKNYLASTDYDGAVKLWDASTGQAFTQYNEHEKRAWSVDFSQVYPTKLASGSDDYTVKLWSINKKNCIGTIRNAANVCCVQFSAHSTYLLAFGSADFRTYCYDLRYAKTPWCVLAGHEKAVSYIKFLDSQTLVSASTDNTLKLWDLNKTTSGGLSSGACGLTLRGHTNEKNFVGLSVAEGYIACGSESNEVYAYHRSLPMPITSHKFGSIDSISGKETDDDNGQFVSSVCWRKKSEMVIAANSSGCIKVLQMV